MLGFSPLCFQQDQYNGAHRIIFPGCLLFDLPVGFVGFSNNLIHLLPIFINEISTEIKGK
jgi:hypothetical protein